MKKVFATLAIMMVLVSAVFATLGDGSNGSATIDIKTKVNGAFPTFKLYAESANTNPANASSAVAATPTAGVLSTADDYLVNNALTVNFKIQQNNLSKTKAKYRLTVTATNLYLVKDENGADVAQSEDADHKFTVNSATPAVTAKTVTGITLSASTNVLTAQYTGKKVDGLSTAVDLGTFSCTWAKNADALPGDYEATVTLTVAAY